MIDINKPLFTGNTTDSGVDTKDLNWDGVPAGDYTLELVTVYKFRDFERDSKIKVRDEDNKIVWHEDGSGPLFEVVKGLKWSMADMVFRVVGGDYDNYAVKGSLSTHPDFIGNTKNFMFSAKLFDISLADVYKHKGVLVNASTYNSSRTYVDANTGLEKTTVTSNVSNYKAYDGNTDSDDNLTGL